MARYETLGDFLAAYHTTGPADYMFSPGTLAWFGESLETMDLLPDLAEITDHGEPHTCYVISTIQKNHPDRSYTPTGAPTMGALLRCRENGSQRRGPGRGDAGRGLSLYRQRGRELSTAGFCGNA